jgi:hypothetical protein
MKHLFSLRSQLLLVMLISAIAGLGLRPAQAQPTFVHSQLVVSKNATILSIAEGPQKHTYCLIRFQDSVRVGAELRRASRNVDALLMVSFDSLRQTTWTRVIESTEWLSRFCGVQVDGAGNVWIAGTFGGGINTAAILRVEGSQTTYSSISNYCRNMWVTSYSANGAWRCTTTFPEIADASWPSLATTQSGNVYLAYTRSQIPGIPLAGALIGSDIKLLKMDTNGQVLATRLDAQSARSSASGSYSIYQIICDPVTEQLYLAGLNSIPVTLGTVALSVQPNSIYSPSLASYAPDLSFRWARQYQVQMSTPPRSGSAMPGGIRNLQLGPQGNLLASVWCRDRITLDTATFQHPAPGANTLCYQAVSISPNGDLQWHTPLGVLSDLGYVSSKRSDFYYLLTTAYMPFTFGDYLALPGPPVTNSTINQPNIVVAALTATGTPAWLRQTDLDSISSTWLAWPSALNVTANGTLALAGQAQKAFSFDDASWQPAANPSWPSNQFLLTSSQSTIPQARIQFLPHAGPPDTTVILNGRNFQGTSAVYFNGVAATSFRVNANGDQIVTRVPAGASTGLISISTPAGTQTSTTAFRVSAPLGTQAAATAVAFYPNPLPRHGTLTVASAAVVQQLTLMDALGRVVQQAAPGRTHPQLTLADVAPGVYALRIGTASGTVVRRLVVE